MKKVKSFSKNQASNSEVSFDLEYLQAIQITLSEWYSENDEIAYRDL